jgi:hypothetical protein
MTEQMPLYSERAAPSFDASKPNQLGRYFRQLETLFTRCGVNDDRQKKNYATSYVDVEIADT